MVPNWLFIVEVFMASDESPPAYKLSVREWTQWRMQAKIKGCSHVRHDICCSYHRNHEGTKLLQMSDVATDIHVGRERRITLVPRHHPGHLTDVADHLPRTSPILKAV